MCNASRAHFISLPLTSHLLAKYTTKNSQLIKVLFSTVNTTHVVHTPHYFVVTRILWLLIKCQVRLDNWIIIVWI
jgi:Na+/H+ antiporter NhaA